jgi:hypothetical protein
MTQTCRINTIVDFGKFDNAPSDSFAFGFVARLDPEDGLPRINCYSCL